MARASAREVARRALRRVASQGAYATLALAGELERQPLSSADRGLATELVYGVLRQQSRLDRALTAQAPRGLKLKGALRAVLRVAAYQILFLDRVPAHAAVDEAVSAAKAIGGERMANFTNGLLRGLARAGEPPFAAELPVRERWSIEHSMPLWIVDLLTQALGGEAEQALAAYARPAPLTARANRMRTTRDALGALLVEERPGLSWSASALCPDALLLAGAGAPEESAAFQDGLWSVQDQGAQLVAPLALPRPGARILDACAGVGGKSTHLAELAGDQAHIRAVDTSQRKLDLSADAARRLGLTCIETRIGDVTRPEEIPAGPYDAILLDAPCSGLGVLRRHPEAKWRIEPDKIGEMAALQARLLDNLAPHVAPGGRLVYAVCTFAPEEGKGQIEAFLGRHPEFAPVDEVSTWPHQGDADAFYAAALQRQDG